MTGVSNRLFLKEGDGDALVGEGVPMIGDEGALDRDDVSSSSPRLKANECVLGVRE